MIPTTPVEEYARSVLKEGHNDRDFVESLARLLPTDGKKPKRFGDKDEGEAVWAFRFIRTWGRSGSAQHNKKVPFWPRRCL